MITIPTYPLWESAGKFQHEQAELKSAHRKGAAQGTISYSVAFFELARSLIQRKGGNSQQQDSQSEDAQGEDEQTGKSKSPQKAIIKEKTKPTFVTRSEPVESASSLYARRMREMVRLLSRYLGVDLLTRIESSTLGFLRANRSRRVSLPFRSISSATSPSRTLQAPSNFRTRRKRRVCHRAMCLSS